MYVEMDNIDTKSPSLHDGLVNRLPDQQTFNMNHICIQPYLLLLYSQEYKVTNLELLTIWGNHYPQYRQSVTLLHFTNNQYHKTINTSNLTPLSIGW